MKSDSPLRHPVKAGPALKPNEIKPQVNGVKIHSRAWHSRGVGTLSRRTMTQHPFEDDFDFETTGDQDLADRHALRRVGGLSTELEDVTEVEYRSLRLERVVLIGVWTEGDVSKAENSMRELALLAETAGSLVLEGLIQRRQK